jgi:Fic family protein
MKKCIFAKKMQLMTFETILEKFQSLKIEGSLNYDLMNEILISHHSTAIEGSTLREEESRMLILNGITAKGKPLTDHLMVKNHYDALVEIDKVQQQDKIFIKLKT